MFVKKGVLAVELPLNMVNPEENIDKYLKNPIYKLKKEKTLKCSVKHYNITRWKRKSIFNFNFQITIKNDKILKRSPKSI